MELAMKIVMYFTLFLCAVYLMSLIRSVDKYFRTESMKKLIETENLKNTTQSISIIDRLDAEGTFLQMLDGMIMIEITNILRTYVTLNQRYNVINLDTDIKAAANNVYSGIKPEFYDHVDHILTSDYILRYITQRSTILFLESIKSMTNIALAQMNTPPENE